MHSGLVSYDIVFHGARMIDGSSSAGQRCDVAVADGRIAAVGELAKGSAKNEIDADGLVLAPGFIDVHTHDDGMALSAPAMAPKVTQGVTTVVMGNCGLSIPPFVARRPLPPPLELLGDQSKFRYARFADYLRALEDSPPAINVAPMVGHTTLRAAAMETLDRPASRPEVSTMIRLLEESLDAGVIGFSTGLFYPPARAAPADEVVQLLKVAAPYGAVYATHMRDEADDVEESLNESFASAKAAGISLVISHHKCMFKRNHGRSATTLGLIDRARAQQTVGLDVYPYIAGSTSLLAELVAKSDRVLITWSTPHPECNGRDLREVAQLWNCSVEQAVEHLIPAGAIYFNLSEDDLQRILRYPHSMIGSDGIPQDGTPHPRLWGTFPRVLGHYARDLGLMPLEVAVHKMTGLPAKTFRVKDRGLIAVGNHADLVLFDADTIADAATFEEPTKPALGIKLVLVNGTIVVEGGQQSTARPGRVLRRTN
jgi:N-acyl-D-amino-acid deacylase